MHFGLTPESCPPLQVLVKVKVIAGPTLVEREGDDHAEPCTELVTEPGKWVYRPTLPGGIMVPPSD